ncbi:hypothetical protein ACIPT3_02210 [Streptomyces diastaticus]|uniref:hypothetical protein n=1 Tax=Streptomyces diastaticus TaxID=1956 RepID=UPI00380BA5FB
MTTFEVLQVETVSGNVIASLPVTGIQYGETLNAAGSATVGVPLDAADPSTLGPARSSLVVLRDGEPEWGGPLWTATADLAAGSLTLNASGWHSYYAARYLDMPGGYEGKTDQALLLRAWIEHSNDNHGIGTDTSHLTTTGKIRSRKWGFAEFKNIAEAINELADEDGGFDFRYQTHWANSRKTRIGHRLLKDERVSLRFPALTHRVDADVTSVAYDGSRMGSTAVAFGADMGTGVKPYHVVANPRSGPALTQVATYADLKSTADLVPKAAALGAMSRQPIAIPTLSLYPGVYASGSFLPGAWGSVNADAGYVQLLEDFVITERRHTVDTNGTETVALSLASKEVFISGDSS